MKLITSTDRIVAISDLRRKFGEIEKALPHVNRFIITKRGKPFAILSADPAVKREMLKKSAGAFVGTPLDDDKLWKDVLKRKSRKKAITL